MKVQILSACKTTDPSLLSIEAEYKKRLKRELALDIVELGGEKFSKLSDTEQRVKTLELIEHRRLAGDVLYILSENGKQLSSQQFAAEIQRAKNSGKSNFSFAIGGAYGIEVPKGKHQTLSLSPMTMPHQLCRVVLIEQLYRATCIIKGHPYHK